MTTNKTNLAIFSAPRAGSNLVYSILSPYMRSKGYLCLPDSKYHLQEALLYGKPCFFKCFPHSFYSPEILSQTKKITNFICLERKNVLRQIISNEVANLRQDWENPIPEGTTYHIQISNLEERAMTVKKYFHYKKLLEIQKIIYYEDFKDKPFTVPKLLGYEDYDPYRITYLPKPITLYYDTVIENYSEIMHWWHTKGYFLLKEELS